MVDRLSIAIYSMRGGVYMTDVALLKKKIAESGMKQTAIYQRLGISKTMWFYKLNGRYPFTAEQIQVLCDVLRITSLREKERIFFASK